MNEVHEKNVIKVGMAKDLDFIYDETEEGKKILDYIKEDY